MTRGENFIGFFFSFFFFPFNLSFDCYVKIFTKYLFTNYARLSRFTFKLNVYQRFLLLFLFAYFCVPTDEKSKVSTFGKKVSLRKI